jgi:hypothetical protein
MQLAGSAKRNHPFVFSPSIRRVVASYPVTAISLEN